MSKKSLNRKKRIRKKRIMLIVEVVILLLLAVFALGSGWLRNKMNLIHFSSTDDDRLITATEANGGAVVDEAALEGKDMIALVGIDSREDAGGNNSDTMIIAAIDHDKKTIRLVSLYRDTYLNIGEDTYTKCNAAYASGGATQMLSMMNTNMDLDLTEYMSVHFDAVVDVIDVLGGLNIPLSKEEMDLVNGYNAETSRVTGHEFREITIPTDMPDDEYWTRHLDGSQALSYARIRYTAGNDFRRTARQRLLLSLMLQKAKEADLATQNEILNKVLPKVETNIEPSKLLSMVKPLITYTIEDSVGFPFDHFEDRGELTGLDCVLPATLESNVRQLHQFLFENENYQPSQVLMSYSNAIIEETGITEEDAPEKSEDGQIPWLNDGGVDVPKFNEGESVRAKSSEESESTSDAAGQSEASAAAYTEETVNYNASYSDYNEEEEYTASYDEDEYYDSDAYEEEQDNEDYDTYDDDDE
ncbi:MAG: LCP family protein [Eubacterium sp.]|nr:LCP family protein [Eubacterium sp.]